MNHPSGPPKRPPTTRGGVPFNGEDDTDTDQVAEAARYTTPSGILKSCRDNNNDAEVQERDRRVEDLEWRWRIRGLRVDELELMDLEPLSQDGEELAIPETTASMNMLRDGIGQWQETVGENSTQAPWQVLSNEDLQLVDPEPELGGTQSELAEPDIIQDDEDIRQWVAKVDEARACLEEVASYHDERPQNKNDIQKWLADVGTSVDNTNTTTKCEEFMHEESKERERDVEWVTPIDGEG